MLKPTVCLLMLSLLYSGLFSGCSEEKLVDPKTVFIEPGNFGVEGFLDKDTYQFVGLRIGEVSKRKPGLSEASPLAFERYQRLVRNKGREYSLFLARLSAYRQLSDSEKFQDPFYKYIYVPEKVNVAQYIRMYSNHIPPLSYRLSKAVETFNVREEIVDQVQLDDIVYRSVIHIKAADLYFRYKQLSRTPVPARDPALGLTAAEYGAGK